MGEAVGHGVAARRLLQAIIADGAGGGDGLLGLKFTDAGGVLVTLSTAEGIVPVDDDIAIAIAVEDTGIGVRAEDLGAELTSWPVLLCTRKDTLIAAFLNTDDDRVWGWDEEKNQPIDGVRLIDNVPAGAPTTIAIGAEVATPV